MQGDSEVVEGNPDRREVLEGAEHDGKRPRSEEDERYVETNALCRVRGPGGHVDEEAESGDVGGERERESDGDGVGIDRIWCWMYGATSGARHDSKRVDTRQLAGVEASQHEQRKHETAYAPRPSIPPPEYHRRPTNQPNPPHRRGHIRTTSRRISQAGSRKSTHQAIWSCRDHIGRVGYVVYVVQGLEMAQERSRGAKREDEGAGVISRPHTGTRKTLAEPRLAISGNRSSAARRCHLE